MAEMTFFSNPECNSSKQKRDHLECAGNVLFWKDLTSHNWTYEELLPFVRGREPLEIMNSSAPDIQKGKIDPLLLTFEQALALLVDKPDLIKGPLVHVDNLYIQGLQDRRLDKYLDAQIKNKRPKILEITSIKRRKSAQKMVHHQAVHPELRYSLA